MIAAASAPVLTTQQTQPLSSAARLRHDPLDGAAVTPSPLPSRPFHLAASDLTVIRGGRRILDRISLTLSAGSRLAVVGENGTGKTTLLHALVGDLPLEHGSLTRTGTAGLAEQTLQHHDDDTVRTLVDRALDRSRAALAEFDDAAQALAADPAAHAERYVRALAVAEQLGAWDAERQMDVALDALGACSDRSRRLTQLSVGQRYRVRLACLLGAPQDLLLLDEPTNHLDAAGVDFLTRRVRAHPGGVALVSHDRHLLQQVAEQFLDLDPSRDGRVRLYGGGHLGWQQGRRRERETWEREHAEQLAEHSRLQEALSTAQNRLSTGWRPEKGTNKHQRQSRAPGVVQQVKRQAEALEEHRITVPPPPLRLGFPNLDSQPGVTYLDATGLRCAERLSAPVDLRLTGGQKLLLTGPNGAGKSTLLGLLAGTLPPTAGELHRRPGARIALVGQENPAWDVSLTARELFETHVARLVSRGTIPRGRAIGLGSLGLLPRDAVNTAVTQLSQGQQRRLELALRLAEAPEVLLLDEPSNHLAMSLIEELTAALQETPAVVVVATHDRQMISDLHGFRRIQLG